VLVAGGGVAAIEAVLGLHALAGERVRIDLLAPGGDFIERPSSVLFPFGGQAAPRVPLERLAELGETTITPDVLRKAGVIKTKHPVKILGDGNLTVALTVSAHKFSKSAQEKITKAGGKVEVLQ